MVWKIGYWDLFGPGLLAPVPTVPAYKQAKRKTQNRLPRDQNDILSSVFWICLGFRV